VITEETSGKNGYFDRREKERREERERERERERGSEREREREREREGRTLLACASSSKRAAYDLYSIPRPIRNVVCILSLFSYFYLLPLTEQSFPISFNARVSG